MSSLVFDRSRTPGSPGKHQRCKVTMVRIVTIAAMVPVTLIGPKVEAVER